MLIFYFSGDVNFASELSDLRHRHGFRIVVIHNKHVSEALLSCAHLSYHFEKLCVDVNERQSSNKVKGIFKRPIPCTCMYM